MNSDFLKRLRELSSEPAAKPTKTALEMFENRPMVSSTLALHGLNVNDAVDLVERKLNRAVRAGAERIDIIFDQKVPRMTRVLEQFLETSSLVKDFCLDDEKPGVFHIKM